MRRVTAAAMIGAALLLAGCSSSSSSSASSSSSSTSSSGGSGGGAPVTVALGFLTNITHASALVGLKDGVTTTTTGGGDAFVRPTTPNSAAVLEFKSGQVDGASEPAPYDIEMVSDGGTVLLSEPGVTTVLVVAQSFLSAHPAVVADLVKAQIQANDFIKSSPAAAQADANSELASYTGKPLKASIVAAAFKEITFTDDPDQSSLTSDASQAMSLGLLKPVNLSGIFDLTPLNTALAAAGESQVSS